MRRIGIFVAILSAALLATSCKSKPEEKPKGTVRVAVIGGMTMSGMWKEVSLMFERETGYKVEVVATGPKPVCADAMKAGLADLLTMHSSDTTTNLVVEGYGVNMRPWTQNELVIVGPTSDPAGIRGLHDGAEALRRIATTQANFVDFQGTGSREVTHPLWVRACTQPQGAWVLKDESKDHLDILNFAGSKHAYVIVGRMPVVFEKLKATGVEILVDGDPAMRRPYVVMEANPKRFPKANTAGARALADFLLSEKVQQYLASNPANQRGNTPLFFPVSR